MKLKLNLKEGNIMQVLSFINLKHPHDLLGISVKYHDNILKSFKLPSRHKITATIFLQL